jgi:hypothetical protein
MNGFGFIEYEDAMDARDVVPGKCSSPPYYHRKTDHCPLAFRKYHYNTYRLISI